MIEFLLYSEVNLICIAIFGVIAFNIAMFSRHLGTRPKTLFKYLWYVIIFYVLDIVGKYVSFSGVDVPPLMNYILDVCYFYSFALGSTWWYMYSGIIKSRNCYKDIKKKIRALLPAMLLLLLFIISYFTGWIFSIEDGNFHRGPLFAVLSTFSFGMIFLAGVRSLTFGLKHTAANSTKSVECKKFAVYSFIMVIAGVLQFKFEKFPVLIIGNTMAVFSMYLNYMMEMISMDHLTRIPTRRKIAISLRDNIKSLRKDEELYFLFIDVDNFKYINDEYGHEEGDRILSELSLLLRMVCENTNSYCGRWGGDEFVVIHIHKTGIEFTMDKQIENIIENENIMMDGKEEMTASIGCSKWCGEEDTIEELIVRADQDMYNNKKHKKDLANLPKGGDAKLSI